MTIKRTRRERRINSREKRMVKQYRNLENFFSNPAKFELLGQVALALTVSNAALRFLRRSSK